MKTPEYNLRSAKSWRERKLSEGWKYFSKLVPPSVYEALQKTYQQLKKK